MMDEQIDPRRVRRNFSCHAGEYDRYAVVQKRVAGRLLELAAQEGFPGGAALDLGTGTGELARRLLSVGPRGAPLVLADLAHPMTCQAVSAVPAGRGVDADAHHLPFRGEAFDLVLSASVFQWLNDLPGALRECSRVLAPGGMLAVALFGEGTLWQLREAHSLALSEGGSPDSSHFQTFPSREKTEDAIAGAGLRILSLACEEEREFHPALSELLLALKKIGAQNASASRPGGLASRRVMSRMADLYRERFAEPDGLPVTYRVIYALARRPA